MEFGMNNGNYIQKDSTGWLFFVRASFVLSLIAVFSGIYFLPVDLWTRGYMAMGSLYLVVSAFTLAKTLRDEHEAEKFHNQIREVKTEKLLKEFELKA